MAVLNRLLFWLFAVFAIGETPLGTGELFGSGEGRSGSLARELRSGDLSACYSTPAEPITGTELTEPNRVTLKVLAVEAGEKAAGIPFAAPSLAENSAATGAVLPADGIRQSPAVGFSSRAPPALA